METGTEGSRPVQLPARRAVSLTCQRSWSRAEMNVREKRAGHQLKAVDRFYSELCNRRETLW